MLQCKHQLRSNRQRWKVSEVQGAVATQPGSKTALGAEEEH